MTAQHPSGELDVAAAELAGLAWPGLPDSAPQTVIILAIGDYVALRRRIGTRRAAALAAWLAAAAHAVRPDATVEIVARDRIEMHVAADAAVPLEAIIEQVELLLREESGLPSITLHGAVASPGPGDTEVDALEAAERALAATPVGAGRPDPITPQFGARALMRELPAAIARGDLFVAYQPKLRLRQQEVAGLEALIRWRHPTYGMLPPSEFIPLAERTGEIASLTLWTIRQVIEEQRIIRLAGHDVPIFINIAGRLLSDAGFVRETCALLAECRPRLGFEITETSVIRDPESAIANLKTFADIGVSIAIDDYGAGLSSLAYLKQLPARELKIDKLFITELTSSNRDPLIVRSTIDLAHALDMEVVAEGVESHATLALLTVMGCDMVQGYLISRPQPLDATLAFLSDDRRAAVQPVPKPFKVEAGWRGV